MRTRRHHGFGHGLRPGTSWDMGCTSCVRERAAGLVPNITGTDTLADAPGPGADVVVVFVVLLDAPECAACGTDQLVDRETRWAVLPPGPDQYAPDRCPRCGALLCDECALTGTRHDVPGIGTECLITDSPDALRRYQAGLNGEDV
jgi:hypothetical protein